MPRNSSGPATSGGESWTTGSPRFSARQIRPSSKSLGERKSRSRRLAAHGIKCRREWLGGREGASGDREQQESGGGSALHP